MKNSSQKSDSQAKKFRDLAREVGADDDEGAFERKLKRIAAPSSKDEKPKPKKKAASSRKRA